MNKMWSNRIREYDSALKRKGMLTPAIVWISLEDIMLSEISQTQNKYCEVLPERQEAGAGGGQSAFTGVRVSAWEGEKVLETDSGDGCTTV